MSSPGALALQQEQQAQDLFLELLSHSPQQAWDEIEAIRGGLVAERILFGDKPIPLIFAPVVLTRKRWEHLAEQMAALNRMLTRLEPVLHEKRWLDWLGFRPEEQEWIRIAGQVRPGMTISRVDGFLSENPRSPQDYKIVELNIDSPGGGAFLDVGSRVVQESKIWQEFARRAPGHTIPFSEALYDHLESVWNGFLEDHPRLSAATGKPRIAIVDWITVSTHREFELLAEGLKQRGFDTVVADPRELQFSLGRLRDYDGKPIDLVYRRVLVEDMLRDQAGSMALVEACRAGAVCLVNNFSSKPLTVKSLLALFHDPEGRELLSACERELVDQLVPITLRLTDDNIELVRREKDRFVLKPADGWGAQGLYLGWRCTRNEWDEHLRRSRALGGYVAQERVEIPSRSLPTWTGDRWECFQYMFDLSPYGLAEKAVSPLVRLSPSEVLNVKQGARIAAVWILD
jgi:uncharacterized circularly permuted ATP-grasp superfamily protein